ncbi:MAG: hypothetical protein ABIQ12_07655 [Opitutaceae bacterium]
MIRRLAFVFSILIAPGAPAAPLERDLGQGLGYVRLQNLPADLPTDAGNHAQAWVVDLRYTAAEPAAAAAFAAWLKFRATPRAPVFVLMNDDTAPALRSALAAHAPARGVVVIGAASPRVRPDSAVTISKEDERRAFDALTEGTAVEALLADNPGKLRNDEASLTKGQSRDLPAMPSEMPADAPSAKRTTPPVDVALQRAVHLHRSLMALKRL